MLRYCYWLCLACSLCLVSCDDQPVSHRVQTDTLEATRMGRFYPKPSLVTKSSTQQEVASPEIAQEAFQTKPTYRKRTPQNTSNIAWRSLIIIQKTKVWVSSAHKAIFFTSGMSIDADGSPRAYHPKNIGLDDLKHAGKNGKWWALATKNGKPVVQKSGYYVSTTSLQDFRYTPWDQRRYVNAEKIPYIVLPPKVKKMGKVSLGDLAVVYNTHNGRWTYAIYADTGANSRIGEGSIALAKKLGINANARKGGISQGIAYLVFPGSGVRKPLSKKHMYTIGARCFQRLGGITHLRFWTKKLH